MNEEILQYIQAWIQKAEHDLKTVEIILGSQEENKPYDTVCFHCQQAAEKYLKAYLIFLDKDFPRTHNIVRLIEIGAETDKNLYGLSKAEVLTSFAADARYPEPYFQMPSREEAESAFAIACEIKKFVRQRMNPGG
jgi:HEPN domain-containing protein